MTTTSHSEFRSDFWATVIGATLVVAMLVAVICSGWIESAAWQNARYCNEAQQSITAFDNCRALSPACQLSLDDYKRHEEAQELVAQFCQK